MRTAIRIGLPAFTAALVLAPPAYALTFAPPVSYPVGTTAVGVVTADFNSDGRPDVATVNGTSDQVSVLLGQPDGGLAPEAGSPFAVGDGPNYAAVGDFNSDGRPDVATANYGSNDVTVLLRQTGGGFAPEADSPIALGGRPSAIVAADFTGDGKLDLAVTQMEANAISVLYRDADGAGFTRQETFANVTGPRQLAVGNFNGDGRPDAVVAEQAPDSVRIEIRRPHGGFAPEPAIPVGDEPAGVVAGDFDGDSRTDVAVANYGSNSVTVLLRNDSNDGFTEQAGSPISVPAGPIGIAAGDFNNDHRRDLGVAAHDAGRLTILRNEGNTFTLDPPDPIDVGSGPYAIAVADLDRDGRSDVAVSHDTTSTLSVLANTTELPTSTERPQLSGTPELHSTLSCTDGTWTGGPTAFVITWERAPSATADGDDASWHAIDGASGPSYAVGVDDVGSRVRCRVLAMSDFGAGEATSTSLRADASKPFNTALPHIVGGPQSERPVTCDPGSWGAGLRFTYRWLRDHQAIAGATSQAYTPTRSRDRDLPSNPNGDGGHLLTCEVLGVSDVGSSVPVRSGILRVVDGPPLARTLPVTRLDDTMPNPIGRRAACDFGQFYNDYGTFDPAYGHEYQWLRNGQPIAGAAGPVYAATIDDLGQTLACTTTASNPLGRAQATSAGVLLPLPAGTGDAKFLKAGGFNQVDPINLMALSKDYLTAVESLTVTRLKQLVADETTACASRPGVPNTAPPATTAPRPLDTTTRCAILLHAPGAVHYGESLAGHRGGLEARYVADGCVLQNPKGSLRRVCPNLGFRLVPIDPARALQLDLGTQAQLAPTTPMRVLWDLDRDGRTDASCPGSAPVLRTLVEPGAWRVRAVLVGPDSATTGIYGSIERAFEHPSARGEGVGALRKAQPFVCRTTIDPPPDPQTGPCLTEGTIGRVRISGNLCPINARRVDPDEYAELPDDLKAVLKAQSEQQGLLSTLLTSPEPAGPFRALRAIAPMDRRISATFSNTSAALTNFSTVTPPKQIPEEVAERLGLIRGFDVQAAPFALDQIYAAKGALKVNGVTVDPLSGATPLLIPSDVRQALDTVRSMRLNVRDAASSLGDLPLAAGGLINPSFTDAASGGTAVLRETNLGDLKDSLLNKRLDLGPFKLAGTATVTLQDDGTATVTAQAVLPFLHLAPGSTENPTAKIVLRGDPAGRLKLDGGPLHCPVRLPGGRQDLEGRRHL